eukprot:scaffold180722_cov13-Tisochrysis_lutea.AAC.1
MQQRPLMIKTQKQVHKFKLELGSGKPAENSKKILLTRLDHRRDLEHLFKAHKERGIQGFQG